MVATPQSLHEFVNFRLQYISGKERSSAQVFLDRFFQAFGHQGRYRRVQSMKLQSLKSAKEVKQALPISFGNPAF